ncbi:M3 family metallopeptidase [Vibrio alginolyticus]
MNRQQINSYVRYLTRRKSELNALILKGEKKDIEEFDLVEHDLRSTLLTTNIDLLDKNSKDLLDEYYVNEDVSELLKLIRASISEFSDNLRFRKKNFTTSKEFYKKQSLACSAILSSRKELAIALNISSFFELENTNKNAISILNDILSVAKNSVDELLTNNVNVFESDYNELLRKYTNSVSSIKFDRDVYLSNFFSYIECESETLSFKYQHSVPSVQVYFNDINIGLIQFCSDAPMNANIYANAVEGLGGISYVFYKSSDSFSMQNAIVLNHEIGHALQSLVIDHKHNLNPTSINKDYFELVSQFFEELLLEGKFIPSELSCVTEDIYSAKILTHLRTIKTCVLSILDLFFHTSGDFEGTIERVKSITERHNINFFDINELSHSHVHSFASHYAAKHYVYPLSRASASNLLYKDIDYVISRF